MLSSKRFWTAWQVLPPLLEPAFPQLLLPHPLLLALLLAVLPPAPPVDVLRICFSLSQFSAYRYPKHVHNAARVSSVCV